jgi:hypothetical protein
MYVCMYAPAAVAVGSLAAAERILPAALPAFAARTPIREKKKE